jgi:hypothetical protein
MLYLSHCQYKSSMTFHEADIFQLKASLIASRQGCGGYQCLNILSNKKGNDCDVADQYMQCVYSTIDSQVETSTCSVSTVQ